MKMNEHKQYKICDYSLRFYPKKNRTFMNLTAYHDDFMEKTLNCTLSRNRTNRDGKYESNIV